MISRTSWALELGATTEGIFETCSVANSMGVTLAWSKALVVADYSREKEIIKQPKAAHQVRRDDAWFMLRYRLKMKESDG